MNSSSTIMKNYPGFPYESDQLVRFIASTEIISLMLKNGKIIHFSPTDREAFIQWLQDNNISDIRRKHT